jgi:hypothetical protein
MDNIIISTKYENVLFLKFLSPKVVANDVWSSHKMITHLSKWKIIWDCNTLFENQN